MQLLEQSVKNNTQDIREMKQEIDRLKDDVSDVKSNQQLTNQNVTHILETLSELKANFKEIDDKMDKNQIEQLKEYKNGVWKIGVTVIRSEEHTSELQSRGHLVCRLLLEKKKHENNKLYINN